MSHGTTPGNSRPDMTRTPPGHSRSGTTGMPPGRSWSGTVDYGPGPLHAPRSVAELQDLVARSPRIRALGTRHSFSTIAASDAELVTLEHLPATIDFDITARTVRRSEEHTSELQSRGHLVCRLLLEKKKRRLPTRRAEAT